VQAAYDADKAPLDLMLEAQRRLADAESRHFQSLAEYAIAIKNVHYAKGTLLDYDGVVLSESGWPTKAYADAAERDALRGKPRPLNYASAREPLASRGPYDQQSLDGASALPAESIEGEPLEALPADDVDPSEPAPEGSPPPAAAPSTFEPASHESLVNPAAEDAAILLPSESTATPARPVDGSTNLAAALEAAAAQ
jgi:hypothetical protein